MAFAAERAGLANEIVLCRRFLSGCFFLQILIGSDGHAAVAAVGHHLADNLRHLLLQRVDELSGVVFLMLDVAQLLLPDAGQLAALQQFLAYGVY